MLRARCTPACGERKRGAEEPWGEEGSVRGVDRSEYALDPRGDLVRDESAKDASQLRRS